MNNRVRQFVTILGGFFLACGFVQMVSSAQAADTSYTYQCWVSSPSPGATIKNCKYRYPGVDGAYLSGNSGWDYLDNAGGFKPGTGFFIGRLVDTKPNDPYCAGGLMTSWMDGVLQEWQGTYTRICGDGYKQYQWDLTTDNEVDPGDPPKGTESHSRLGIGRPAANSSSVAYAASKRVTHNWVYKYYLCTEGYCDPSGNDKAQMIAEINYCETGPSLCHLVWKQRRNEITPQDGGPYDGKSFW
jgi:hypothetical protein